MNLHYVIKLANLALVISLGLVTLRLLVGSLLFDRVRRSSPSKRAELFFKVFRKGAPFLKVVLDKSHYRVGRGPECDILIKGEGIPLQVGDLFFKDNQYFFRKSSPNFVTINGQPGPEGLVRITLEDEIRVNDYSMRIAP